MLDKPAIASMWKLVSSSFSNSMTFKRYASPNDARFSSSRVNNSVMTASSSMPSGMFDAAVFAFGSVSILTPFFGVNAGTSTFSIICTSAASSFTPAAGRSTPPSSALRLAKARMSVTCATSEDEKMTGLGKRFGALQNGEPVDVTASSGNVKVSCKILSWNCSWNCPRAHATHS